MITHLIRHGDELALVLRKSHRKFLKISRTSSLVVETDGKSIFIRRATAEDIDHDRTFRRALVKGNRKYGKALRRLRD
jgi:hypothetical protein